MKSYITGLPSGYEVEHLVRLFYPMAPLTLTPPENAEDCVWAEKTPDGLHALVRFDSVAPPEDGERRLYESLALLLENSRPQLERLILDQEAQRQARQQSAARYCGYFCNRITNVFRQIIPIY